MKIRTYNSVKLSGNVKKNIAQIREQRFYPCNWFEVVKTGMIGL